MQGELTLFKRPKGHQWQCRFKLPNGQWHAASTATEDLDAAQTQAVAIYETVKVKVGAGLAVNLKTLEILCIGLGYKNQIYSFELSKYMHAHKNGLQITDAVKCSENFYALDHHNIAKLALKTMEQLGINYYEYDNLQGTADVFVSLNEDDGLYYFDDYDTDEGMTSEEVDELRLDYEKYSEWIEDCANDLRAYFPKLETWELNSGAY